MTRGVQSYRAEIEVTCRSLEEHYKTLYEKCVTADQKTAEEIFALIVFTVTDTRISKRPRWTDWRSAACCLRTPWRRRR